MTGEARTDVRVVRLDPARDAEGLIRFLSTNRFPFHGTPAPTAEAARTRVEGGAFDAPDSIAYWIEAGGERVGVLHVQEATDSTPLLDLRIAESARGAGIGTAALRLGTAAVFHALPEVTRIEGNTRVDNAAMRAVFERCGYVKEAHYRRAWPVAGAEPLDTVAYAILRSDWRTGTTTPVAWES
ncbi:MAG: GNAT family N-acetyltransferase [Leifsonia sp.]|uniref:GNAT family N-acetyltransferase n=1 Tax=Leifsonia sp. TaxID=1870902 RepID=UPI003F7CD87F